MIFSIPFSEYLTEQCGVAKEINDIKLFFAAFVILLPMLKCSVAVFHISFHSIASSTAGLLNKQKNVRL